MRIRIVSTVTGVATDRDVVNVPRMGDTMVICGLGKDKKLISRGHVVFVEWVYSANSSEEKAVVFVSMDFNVGLDITDGDIKNYGKSICG